MSEMQQLVEDLEKRLAGSQNCRQTEVSKEQQQLYLCDFLYIRLHEVLHEVFNRQTVRSHFI